MQTSKIYAYLALMLGVLTIGFAPIFIRWAQAPGMVTMLYRMSIGASLLFIPFVRNIHAQKIRPPRKAIYMAMLGGTFFGLDLVLWSTGVTMSNATVPTLMANTAPLWVGLGALLIFRERQTLSFWIGLIVALAGAVTVLGPDLMQATEFGIGSVLGIAAALFYAAFYLATQQARNHLDTLTYFGISTFSSAVVLLILNLILRQSIFGYSAKTYVVFLMAGIIGQGIGWMAVNYAQGVLPASIVAPTMLGQPVVTALFAGPLLGETFTAWHVGGGMTVLAGVLLVHRSRVKE